MRLVRPVLLFLVLAFAGMITPAAQAAEPPNQNDPCSTAGRNTCGTNGVGRYTDYRYGIRWFGDYRGAVPEETDPTFCIDLRFWYPSKKFGYKERSTDGLKNKDGKRIPETRLRYMNYALWKYGRTKEVTRQAATMLYVHHLMGDGAPGEVDPAAVSPAVKRTFDAISRDAKRYAGPYRVKVDMPTGLVAGTEAKLSVQVISAAGEAVPDVPVRIDARGGAGLSGDVRTGSTGTATVAFTPDDAAGDLSVTATAQGLAAEAPKMYAPTRGAAARSGQRLVSAAATARSSSATAAVEPAQIAVTTQATPNTLAVGGQSIDVVRITGAPAGWSQTVQVALHGPFPTQAAITCSGTPEATTSYVAGPGESRTPAITLTKPGWYGYQLTIPSTPNVTGLTTPCVPAEETVQVQSQPLIVTQISEQVTTPGSSVTDKVIVSGLNGATVTVEAELWGPYPAADAMTCTGAPFWKGSFTANGDGTYTTDPVKLTVAGYYTYREAIAASDTVKGVQTPCGEAAETTVVRGTPQIVTQINNASTAPGSQLQDTAVVTGLGALRAEVGVELWGPYPTRESMTCAGAPFWTGKFTANGDGSYLTDPVTVTTAGYYTYRERILPSGAFAGVETACGEATETTLTTAAPKIVTEVSDQVVAPGTSISDRITVTGLGTTPATIEVQLFGPFMTRAEISCGGRPRWTGTVDVAGDGTVESPEVTVPRAGFYTYRERIAGTGTITETQTPCAEESETSLAAPLILTGRTEKPRPGKAVARRGAEPEDDARAGSGPRPTRVMYQRLGIRAEIRAAGIDERHGALDVPKDIDRVGWWKDGAAPGGDGSVLLAGHVDSKKRGAGAFYALKSGKRGDRVTVTTSDNKTRTYRVTGVRTVNKDSLPQAMFSRSGEKRLYLVTCGGPFNTRTGHYRDNVIV
ncbi:MAG: sortase, partial [Solirubrobacteraceae bacterium]|nr:sortase [Solirubrobacteraceae bacterium]